jgi:TPR repeat protein
MIQQIKGHRALMKAAQKGDMHAQWDLAYYYENLGGQSSVQNRAEAIHWYTKAAKLGYVPAKVSLSDMLSGGDKPDYKAAIAWAKSAIAEGNSTAAFNLGIIYRDLGKPKTAFRYYQLAVQLGDPSAHLQIGLCYLLGFGVSQDHNEAEKRFQSVLDSPAGLVSIHDREDALYWLALMPLLGLSKPRHVGKARVKLLQANADDDHGAAKALLGVIGRSVPANRQTEEHMA